MENKPIVTCHGDQTLFSTLHSLVLQGLPREPVEWRRSYGRAPRTINCAANFVPFNPDILPSEDDWTLLGRPFFHTYWTECDLDTYKSMVKDEIAEWLAALKVHNISDWLIIVVVNDESKVKTKLLRQSVVDKVKSDFCSKQGERCVVLSEPLRNDSRSSESWGQMLSRMRQLLLQSFNKSLSRFEEYMRAQRERRTEADWNFNQYFMLQEELAFMFEMLGLLEDALVQYDELDALFTQFVLNHVAGDTAAWLSRFSDIPCSNWDGLCLSQPINIDKRQLVKHSKASLLDFRNYLFSRQCTLLFLLLRPWEVAQRCVPFMHNCIQELDMLELKMLPGAVACWVFLSCLEVLQTCDKFTDTGQMEAYSLHTASLWDYARNKLYVAAKVCGLLPGMESVTPSDQQLRMAELLTGALPTNYDIDEGTFCWFTMHDLGLLCGLMPGSETTSNQLNLVVDLISGMTQKEGDSEPLAKLREALSSKEAFRKHYMELSELAMGTFKHIGRIRSARLIGRDLAAFYMKLNQPEKAEGFLLDALKMYKQENWYILADNTSLDIARCQKLLNNDLKYVKSCCHVAASKVLAKDTRLFYQREMMNIANYSSTETLYVRSKPAFLVRETRPSAASFILNGECSIHMTITSNLLEPVHAAHIAVSLITSSSPDPEASQTDGKLNGSQSFSRSRHSSMSSVKSVDPDTPQSPVSMPIEFEIEPHIEMAPNNKSVMTTSIVSKTVIKRVDSGPNFLREKEAVKEKFDTVVEVLDVLLNPGENKLVLKGVVTSQGTYAASQLCIQVNRLEFLRHLGSNPVTFDVASEEPSILMNPLSEPLLAGVPHKFVVSLNAGSHAFDDSHELSVTATCGLSIEGDMMTADGKMGLPPADPYDTIDTVLTMVADLPQEPVEATDHVVTLSCGWLPGNISQPLTFKHPMVITHKLHTSGQRKYIQVVVHGSTDTEFYLSEPKLIVSSRDVEVSPLNKPGQKIIVNGEQSASYMWQLSSNIPDTPPLTGTFSVMYQLTTDEQSEPRRCQCTCTVENYKTLYMVKTEATPGDKGERCSAGSLCHLKVCITSVGEEVGNERSRLMYEVLADPTNWAVCGKSSGVLEVEKTTHEVHLDVMPLMAGYLPLPGVKLVKYLGHTDGKEKMSDIPLSLATWTEDDNSPPEQGLPHLVPFHPGQVYYGSAATQIQVLPACNTSHVDIIVTPL